MDILVVLLFILLLYKVSFFNGINKEYISAKTCNGWRGFFALIIVFHHLSALTHGGVLFRGFTTVGYLGVAFFFFLSGYGLQKKYILDANYKKGFITKRIPTVLIPYVIVTLIYWGVNALSGELYSLLDVFKSITYVNPLSAINNKFKQVQSRRTAPA